jgi:hypothetical protein
MEIKNYKSLFKEQSEEEKAKQAIEELIDTNWSASNEDQGKASQLFKALAFNDSNLANNFIKKIDEYTNTLKDEFLNKKEEQEEISSIPVDEELPLTYEKVF